MTVHVAVNIMTLKKINILEYALGRGRGSLKRVDCSLYTFINVDNCERPLSFISGCTNAFTMLPS